MKLKNINLVNLQDHIKSNWFLWNCTAELPDGRVVEGTIQADGSGNMIAEETFEMND